MIYDNKIRIPTEEETFGNNKLDIIEMMGTKCAITDFAILLGAMPGESDISYDHVSYDSSLKGRTSSYYIITSDNHIKSVTEKGKIAWSSPNSREGGIRPVIPFSCIPSDVINSWKGKIEIEYGEYPQYAESRLMLNYLDLESYYGKVVKSGKIYTSNTLNWQDKSYEAFKPLEYAEYVYIENGRKYIIVNYANTKFRKTPWHNYILSNGICYYTYDSIYHKMHDVILVRVSPLKWYVDYINKLIICKNIILSGLRFGESYDGDFNNTEMSIYLNVYFANEIIPSDTKELVRKKLN